MSMTTTERVWEAFHTPLQHFIRRRISDEASAEDVLQDVFLKIHQHVETLKDVKKLESWIYQITRNAIIDSYRSRKPTTDARRRKRCNRIGRPANPYRGARSDSRRDNPQH